MISFLAATAFLTVFPVPQSVHKKPGALRHAAMWFPLVGLLLGAALAAADTAFGIVFPPAVRSVLTILTLTALSRGLHIDGLADAADGLYNFRSKEKALEIMRDPRSGPMGVAAVAGDIALKAAALFYLDGPMRWKILLLMPMAGRCAMALTMGLFPYARVEGGLASAFENKGRVQASWSAAALLLLSIVLGRNGLLAGMVSLAGAFVAAAWIKRKIGGYTGDTLGAVNEWTEVLWLLAAVSAHR